MTVPIRRTVLVRSAVALAAILISTGSPTPSLAETGPAASVPSGVSAPSGHEDAPAASPPPGQPLSGGQQVADQGLGAHISPELAGVSVRSEELTRRTSARNRAIDVLAGSHARKQRALDSLRSLDMALGRAHQAVVDATVALADAQEVLRQAREVLAARQSEAAAAEQRLADAQEALRTLAVAAYLQPENDMTWLSGDPGQLLDGESGEVVANALGRLRVNRMVRRGEELGAAQDAVVAAADHVAVSVEAVEDRTAELASRKSDVIDTERRIRDARAEDAAADEAIYLATGELAAAEDGVADARVLATVDGADFPLVALDAYWKAAQAARCRIEWWALAGISQVESQHGTYRGASLDARGVASPAIIGIPLNGENDTAVIGDSDGGLLDFDTVFDRAVGPMQFIPSTWRMWAADGNGDGVKSPHDLYDVAMAAGGYLCASGGDLTSDEGLRLSYFTYNFSVPYVDQVLGYARGYEASVRIPSSPSQV